MQTADSAAALRKEVSKVNVKNKRTLRKFGRETEFKFIRKNKYSCKGKDPYDDFLAELKCKCTRSSCSDALSCQSQCDNRNSNIECSKKCAMGDQCGNRRFTKAEYRPCLLACYGEKGLGIQAVSSIPKNTFIMELVGEVIDADQLAQRMDANKQSTVKKTFTTQLTRGFYIDTTSWGNYSRFTNHSCQPNAELQLWLVNGRNRLGLFSAADIAPGEEITIDYRMGGGSFADYVDKCLCKTPNCKDAISNGVPQNVTEECNEKEQLGKVNQKVVKNDTNTKKGNRKRKASVDTESNELPVKIKATSRNYGTDSKVLPVTNREKATSKKGSKR